MVAVDQTSCTAALWTSSAETFTCADQRASGKSDRWSLISRLHRSGTLALEIALSEHSISPRVEAGSLDERIAGRYEKWGGPPVREEQMRSTSV